MRTILVFCFVLSLISALRAQTVCYSYDAAGNRTSKFLGPCPSNNIVMPGGQSSDIAESEQLQPQPQKDETQASVQPPVSDSPIVGKVFPNPNDGQFSLLLDKEASAGAWFELYDAKGALKSKLLAEGTSFAFDLSGSPAGEYFLFLRTLGGSYGQWKVVKE